MNCWNEIISGTGWKQEDDGEAKRFDVGFVGIEDECHSPVAIIHGKDNDGRLAYFVFYGDDEMYIARDYRSAEKWTVGLLEDMRAISVSPV